MEADPIQQTLCYTHPDTGASPERTKLDISKPATTGNMPLLSMLPRN